MRNDLERGVHMIKSMTGYGRGEAELNGRSIVIELKSVNNRYLDCNVRLPAPAPLQRKGLKTGLRPSHPGKGRRLYHRGQHPGGCGGSDAEPPPGGELSEGHGGDVSGVRHSKRYHSVRPLSFSGRAYGGKSCPRIRMLWPPIFTRCWIWPWRISTECAARRAPS